MSTQQELLNTFHEIATHPRKQMQAYLDKGYQVAGCVAPYAPEELIHSFGIVPFGLWGADLELKDAKRYFPTFICSIMQSVIELGIQGKFDGLSFVMIPSLCDSMQVTAENWKYAVPGIPVLFSDYPHNRSKAGHDYLVATHKRHIEQIEKITGIRFCEENLNHSLDIYQKHAELMLAFSDLAAKCNMKPSDRCAVFKSAWFMLKEDHSALVEALMETMKPSNEKCVRLITTGILADQEDLLKTLDELHVTIVSDDVAHESRQYYVSYEGENGLDRLANKFCSMNHCSLIYDREKTRISLLIQECKDYHADALLMLQTKFCDPEEFDYVILKNECEKAGIPFVMIEVDRQMKNYSQAKTALQTLCEIV